MITLTESPSGGQLQIKEEGSVLGVASVLNFTGACIDATYSGSTVTLDVKKLLGWLNLSCSLYKNPEGQTPGVGVSILKAPDNTRSIQDSYILDGTDPMKWNTPLQYGDLTGTFNTTNGQWTAPVDGHYSFTIFSGLAVAPQPHNALIEPTINPTGFFDAFGVDNPRKTFNFSLENPTLEFNDFIGHYTIGLTTLDGSRIITSNTQYAYYNSSQLFITATEENVYLTAGTTLVCRYLNKCKNTIIASQGNSYHFSVVHLK